MLSTGSADKPVRASPQTEGSKTPSMPRAVSAARQRPLRLKIHSALRWLHIYISMFSLLAILFFSITGITLNHPDWALNNSETKTELKSRFVGAWKQGNKVDWLSVVETLRQHGARGIVTDKSVEDNDGAVSFKAPGYAADCEFDVKAGTYTLSVTQQGFVGMMNDFHRGTDSSAAWHRVMDLSGIFLTVVALTGLGLLYYLKKVRLAGFLTLGVGCLLVWLLMKFAG